MLSVLESRRKKKHKTGSEFQAQNLEQCVSDSKEFFFPVSGALCGASSEQPGGGSAERCHMVLIVC